MFLDWTASIYEFSGVFIGLLARTLKGIQKCILIGQMGEVLFRCMIYYNVEWQIIFYCKNDPGCRMLYDAYTL